MHRTVTSRLVGRGPYATAAIPSRAVSAAQQHETPSGGSTPQRSELETLTSQTAHLGALPWPLRGTPRTWRSPGWDTALRDRRREGGGGGAVRGRRRRLHPVSGVGRSSVLGPASETSLSPRASDARGRVRMRAHAPMMCAGAGAGCVQADGHALRPRAVHLHRRNVHLRPGHSGHGVLLSGKEETN